MGKNIIYLFVYFTYLHLYFQACVNKEGKIDMLAAYQKVNPRLKKDWKEVEGVFNQLAELRSAPKRNARSLRSMWMLKVKEQ